MEGRPQNKIKKEEKSIVEPEKCYALLKRNQRLLKELDASGELLIQKQRWLQNPGIGTGLGDCCVLAVPGDGNPSPRQRAD